MPTTTPETVVNGRPLKACIAIPPVFDFYATPHRCSGLGAEIAAGIVRAAGCPVEVFHFPLQGKKGAPVPLPAALPFLSPFLVPHEWGKLSFFTQYQRFGPPVDTCAEQVVKALPDIVFIACFAFCYAGAALELAARIRAGNPRVAIAMCGAGASAYPEFFIRRTDVDFVLSGEAEVSLSAFLEAFRSASRDFTPVPNLFRKIDGRVFPPATTIRTKAEEIRFVLKKTGETKTAIHFTTALSRGCPKQCRFCSNFLCHGRTFRVIPIDTIRQALADLPLPAETDKSVTIHFEDDNLLLAPEYFLAIMNVFKTRFAGFAGVSFLAENGVDHTRLTPELTEILIRNGMGQFNLSIASTHASILREEQRKAEFSLYEKAVKTIHGHGIPCITYFICGLKSDTPETVVANILYLADLPTMIGISLFYPVPGIPDYTDTARFDAVPPCLCAGSSAFPWNGSLTTGQMVTAFRLARLVNLMKSDHRTDLDDVLIHRIFREKTLYTIQKQKKSSNIIPAPLVDEAMVRLFFEGFEKRRSKKSILCFDGPKRML